MTANLGPAAVIGGRIRLTVAMKRRATAVLLISGMLLAACGAEASDREAFVRAMERQGEMTPAQAECMAVEVFDNSDLTESQINEGADALEGASAFQTVFEAALDVCD
jgi:hypothetical protein